MVPARGTVGDHRPLEKELSVRRPITTKAHGVLDYVGGIVLILAPWIFGFSDVTGATIVPIALGVVILAQSVVTDYELGLMRVLPMKAHLALDAVGGLALLLSPLVIGFFDEGVNAWLPHILVGVALIGAARLTKDDPDNEVVATGGGRTVVTN